MRFGADFRNIDGCWPALLALFLLFSIVCFSGSESRAEEPPPRFDDHDSTEPDRQVLPSQARSTTTQPQNNPNRQVPDEARFKEEERDEAHRIPAQSEPKPPAQQPVLPEARFEVESIPAERKAELAEIEKLLNEKTNASAPAVTEPRFTEMPEEEPTRRKSNLTPATALETLDRARFVEEKPLPQTAKPELQPASPKRTSTRTVAPETNTLVINELEHARFVSGEGLDRPEESLNNFKPLVPVQDRPAEVASEVGQPIKERKSEQQLTAEERLLRIKASEDLKLNPKNTDKKVKEQTLPEDPEERLKSILANVETMKDRLKQMGVVGQAELRDLEHTLDDNELIKGQNIRAMRAIQSFNERVKSGVVSGVVYEGKSETRIPARVKIVDASDLAAGAKLPEIGFWCNGTFRVPAISGKVEVEVSAGRFRSIYRQAVNVLPGRETQLEIRLYRSAAFQRFSTNWHLADLNLGLWRQRDEWPLWDSGSPGLNDAIQAARGEGLDILGLRIPLDTPEVIAEEAQFLREIQAAEYGIPMVVATFPGPQHAFNGVGLGIGVTEWSGLPVYLSNPLKPLRDGFVAIREKDGLATFDELEGRHYRQELRKFFPHLSKTGFIDDKDRQGLLYAPTEFAFDTVTGPVYDVVAFDGSATREAIWFNLLNEGYTVPIVGAGGGSLEAGRIPGLASAGQTFVHIEGVLTRSKLVERCRSGNSVVTFGPAAFLQVFERKMGPGARLPANGSSLNLQIRAFSSFEQGARLERIELIRNGVVVHRVDVDKGMTEMQEARYNFEERNDAWYLLRVTESIGQTENPAGRTFRSAWTNPIYFDTQGRTLPSPEKLRIYGRMTSLAETPLSGQVTAIEPDGSRHTVDIGVDGTFRLQLSAAGVLVFSAAEHEPLIYRPFEDPRLQRELGELFTERNGSIRNRLAERKLFGWWRLLLADWPKNIVLVPMQKKPLPAVER